MARLVCRNSILKSDDYRARNNAIRDPLCDLCDMYQLEDVSQLYYTVLIMSKKGMT